MYVKRRSLIEYSKAGDIKGEFFSFFCSRAKNVTKWTQLMIGPEIGPYGCNQELPALKQNASALPAHKAPYGAGFSSFLPEAQRPGRPLARPSFADFPAGYIGGWRDCY